MEALRRLRATQSVARHDPAHEARARRVHSASVSGSAGAAPGASSSAASTGSMIACADPGARGIVDQDPLGPAVQGLEPRPDRRRAASSPPTTNSARGSTG